MSWVSDHRERATCPECGIGAAPSVELPHFMLDVIDITSSEDTELGLVRMALRCQGCGYAQAFVGQPAAKKTPPVDESVEDWRRLLASLEIRYQALMRAVDEETTSQHRKEIMLRAGRYYLAWKQRQKDNKK